jgi:hypothetical protein
MRPIAASARDRLAPAARIATGTGIVTTTCIAIGAAGGLGSRLLFPHRLAPMIVAAARALLRRWSRAHQTDAGQTLSAASRDFRTIKYFAVQPLKSPCFGTALPYSKSSDSIPNPDLCTSQDLIISKFKRFQNKPLFVSQISL